MPIYEYRCQKCRRVTELIQRVGERPIRLCPHCGGKVRKAFSAPAIQFKGSGFYITDYPKGKTGDTSSSSGKSDSGKSDSGKESGKSEAKSESGKAEATEKPAEKRKETKETKGKKPAKD